MNDDGKPRSGSKLENQYIRLGFGLFKDDKEKVFIGSKSGDSIVVSMPGKDHDITYEVKINRVEEQVLPELNDELAQNINENAKNLNDLKQIIKDQIQTSLDKDHNDAIRKEIINYFIQKSKLDAPESMINRYLEHVEEDLKKRKQVYKEDDLKKNFQSQAEWNIKWYLLKGKLLENEKLDVTDAEIEDKIKEMINTNKNEKQINDYYKQNENKQKLFDEMLNNKLFEKLKDGANIIVVEQSTDELRKQEQSKK